MTEMSAVRRWGLTHEGYERGPLSRASLGMVFRCEARYAFAMSPRKCSCRNVPAPLPLSYQCLRIRCWCRRPVYSKSNAQFFELSKHEKVAFGPNRLDGFLPARDLEPKVMRDEVQALAQAHVAQAARLYFGRERRVVQARADLVLKGNPPGRSRSG